MVRPSDELHELKEHGQPHAEAEGAVADIPYNVVHGGVRVGQQVQNPAVGDANVETEERLQRPIAAVEPAGKLRRKLIAHETLKPVVTELTQPGGVGLATGVVRPPFTDDR